MPSRLFTAYFLLSHFSIIYAEIAYVSSSTGNVYQVNLETGAYTTTATISGGELIGIALSGTNTAYVTENLNGKVYQVNLQTGEYTTTSTITTSVAGPVSPASLTGIALSDSNTAYVASANQQIYKVNLQNGSYTTLATIAPNGSLYGIALSDSSSNFAYVTDFDGDAIDRVDLATGAHITTATLSSIQPLGIALSGNDFAYVNGIGMGFGNIYQVNLQTGAYTTTATLNTSLTGIALLGNDIAYATSHQHIYQVNLQTGAYTTAATITGAFLEGIVLLSSPIIFSQISAVGLSGNNLIFANYLNKNAPASVIQLFALLQGGALSNALESAAPTRNAISTYFSQNSYFASSQMISDHLRKKRFRGWPARIGAMSAVSNATENDFLAEAYLRSPIGKRSERKKNGTASCYPTYTAWLGPFGEYAREKAQHQTPAFSAGLGGAVIGVDRNFESGNVAGVGGAYVHTHVHESGGMGDANINQGYLTAYGTLNEEKWYFDLALWGGYYQSSNHRYIHFPGFNQTATSGTGGWQIAPHLEIGYDGFQLLNCNPNRFGVEPFLMGDWVGNWEHHFREHGGGGLNMGQKGRFCSFIRVEPGLRLHEIAEFNWGKIVFREKGSYVYQKTFHTGNITAFLVGSPGQFTLTTLTSAQNLGVGEFEIMFLPNNGFYANLGYQGEFGSKYQSHQGMVEMGIDF